MLKPTFRWISSLLSRKHLYLTKSLEYRMQEQVLPPNLDYVRYATLGLCFEEIMKNEVPGNVAEVGVYKGDFAKRLNTIFNDRRLYLFDTFEGFTQQDITVEQQNGFSNGNQDFSDTSIRLVESKMPYPQNCIFQKGYFPQTAEGINDQFCFVSLDADLFLPIYEGLNFFYPRLQPGGYIFIHDFNNDQYKGARKAVQQFCKENHTHYSPIPDNGGTALITK